MPCIMPYFYKFSITPELAHSIKFLEFPVHKTIIHQFIPLVLNSGNFLQDGMQPKMQPLVSICFQSFQALRNTLANLPPPGLEQHFQNSILTSSGTSAQVPSRSHHYQLSFHACLMITSFYFTTCLGVNSDVEKKCGLCFNFLSCPLCESFQLVQVITVYRQYTFALLVGRHEQI